MRSETIRILIQWYYSFEVICFIFRYYNMALYSAYVPGGGGITKKTNDSGLFLP